MALALKDRVKETTIVVGTGSATLLGSSIGFQPFSVVGNGNTTYYCISDQFGSNWEVGIGTYSSSGNTLARTTVLASSNGGALVVFTAGVKDVFVTYPAEKGVWLDASNNAIGLGTPAAFVGTNITGTASGLTAGNVTTNANLSGAVSSIGNSTSLGSFTSAQLALAISDETGTGKAVFATNPTLTSPTYAGTLTGSTDILNIGSGQIYKDASGNVGIGTSSPASKLDIGSGNLNFSSTAQRITGDFSNATAVNRLAFQTITTNGNTIVPFIPNGSATQTNLVLYNGSDVTTNFNLFTIRHNLLSSSFTSALGGTGTYVPITFEVGGEKVRIDTSGNVGIGTSSPSSYGRLAVMTPTASYGYFGIANSSGGGGGLQMAQYYGTTKISYIDSILSNGTPGSETAGLAFATASVGTVAEKMRIDSAGNVGIGTSIPANKLTVSATTATQSIVSTTTGNAAYLVLQNSADSSNAYVYATGKELRLSQADTSASSIVTINTQNTERMRIDSAGNVGIGTTSPSGKLDVAGTIKTLGYTVATLPTGVVGARAYVTNALAPTFGATVVAGGAVTIPVFYNGTNWIVG